MEKTCNLQDKGFKKGSCDTLKSGQIKPACNLTLRNKKGNPERLISAAHLSRPENYLSIYQSGCNFSCRKCHSWYFSKQYNGKWYSVEALADLCIEYEKEVTLHEERYNATSWHAHNTCRCCGYCVMYGKRPPQCPGVLTPEHIIFSPQGWGPARNIVAFTGGDLTCQPEFYTRFAQQVKEKTSLWVLIETNGYGLIPSHLDLLKDSGVDSFWLDIKAYDEKCHKWLTGCGNEMILKLPGEMKKRDFVLEVLSLYIPELVETDQLVKISKLLCEVDHTIPFTILAFFPEYKMKSFRSPKAEEIIETYEKVRETGLENVRIGNLGVFLKTDKDYKLYEERVGFM